MKDCLILGFPTALIYKEVYPLLLCKTLQVSEREIHFKYGNREIAAKWFYTLQSDIDKDKWKMDKTYNPNDYPTYNNAPDIIECSRTSNLPVDYQGKIGVPISFFVRYPFLDYDILEHRGDLLINGKNVYERLIIKKKKET